MDWWRVKKIGVDSSVWRTSANAHFSNLDQCTHSGLLEITEECSRMQQQYRMKIQTGLCFFTSGWFPKQALCEAFTVPPTLNTNYTNEHILALRTTWQMWGLNIWSISAAKNPLVDNRLNPFGRRVKHFGTNLDYSLMISASWFTNVLGYLDSQDQVQAGVLQHQFSPSGWKFQRR